MTRQIKINWICTDGVSFTTEQDAEKYQALLNKTNKLTNIIDYYKIDNDFTEIIAIALLNKDHQSGKNTHLKLEDWLDLYKGVPKDCNYLMLNTFNSEVRYIVSNLMQSLIKSQKEASHD